MKSKILLAVGLLCSLAAVATTAWKVSEPTWSLRQDVTLGTYSSEATCTTAAKAQPPGKYICTDGETHIVGTDSGGGINTGPTPPAPTGAIYSVYSNGVLGGGDGNWVDDFDDAKVKAVSNYKDTSGVPSTGTYDFKLDGSSQQWPIWLPYSNNPPQSWDVSQYNYITVQLKGVKDVNSWHIAFFLAGDKALASTCTQELNAQSKYMTLGNAGKNVWTTFKVPLADLCVAKLKIYKFAVQWDQDNTLGVVYYINNAFFLGV